MLRWCRPATKSKQHLQHDTTKTHTTAPPHLGISAQGLRLVIDTFFTQHSTKDGGNNNNNNNNNNKLEKLTTADIVFTFIKPLTLDKKNSFFDMLLQHPTHADTFTPHIQPATTFVSHAWCNTFRNTVEAITSPKNSLPHKQTFYFLDFLAQSQHDMKTLPISWFSNAFADGVRQAQHVLAVVTVTYPLKKKDDDNNNTSIEDSQEEIELTLPPTSCLARVWCIFELFTAIKSGCTVQLCFTERDRAAFARAATENCRALFERWFDELDIGTAQCSYPKVRQQIMGAVKSAGGVAVVTEVVFTRLRTIIMELAVQYVAVARTKLQSDKKHKDKEQALAFVNDLIALLALFYRNDPQNSLTNQVTHLLAEAEQVITAYKLDIQYRIRVSGFKAQIPIRVRDDYKSAASVFRELAEYAEKELGPDNRTTKTQWMNYCVCCKDPALIDDAIARLEAALKREQERFGESCDQEKVRAWLDELNGNQKESTATEIRYFTSLQHNLAKLLHTKNVRLDEAEQLTRDALQRRLADFGDENNITLATMKNLVDLLFDVGKTEEALVKLEETLTFRTTKWGTGHKNTIAVCEMGIPHLEALMESGNRDKNVKTLLKKLRKVLSQSKKSGGT